MRITARNIYTLSQDDKIQPFHKMAQLIRDLKKSDLQVILAQGVFDIIHQGHVGYLQVSRHVRRSNVVLIVGIENDLSVRRNKGTKRPINSAAERLAVLAEFISAQVVFEYPDVPDYTKAEDFINRYRELSPTAISVASWDPHLELKRLQAFQTGVSLAAVHYQHTNSTTRMLHGLGYE